MAAMQSIQPLTGTPGAPPAREAEHPMTRSEIVAAFTRWENDFRAGRCIPSEQVLSMPVGEAAAASADSFLAHLDAVRAEAAKPVADDDEL